LRNKALWMIALAALFGAVAQAQDISGDWQGTLKMGAAEIRVVMIISKGTDGGWKAREATVDQGSDGVPADSVTLQGSELKLTFDRIKGAYQGNLSADGTSIAGTWTQGSPLPLDLKRATSETTWRRDTTPHSIQFITVENIPGNNVKLEVLDWGGTGRPMVLLTGQGNNAHGYDQFAPKLIGAYHVYGITRRGYGASSAPAPTSVNYAADRLGDDVLAVIDALKLNKPVLVGHSLGGEELSSVGSRHPEKVAGLIYLDAGYSYAFYEDHLRENLNIRSAELQKKLEQLQPGMGPRDIQPLIRELLETSLPALEKDLREVQKHLDTKPPPPAATSQPSIEQAIRAGMQEYTDIRVPILAIYAFPHDRGITDPAARAAADATDLEMVGSQIKAFETALPSARVVRLPHANHYVFQSNEADVLREMNAFIGSLP
jgi:non-heme chloroperoxidase